MKKIFLLITLAIVTSAVFAQHKIILKSGESMNGEVKSLKDGEVVFLFKGNSMTFKVNDIQSIHFNQTATTIATTKENTTEGQAGGVINYSYNVPGRKVVKGPEVTNLKQEHGKVVLDITVDKYGNVVKAEPGASGTNTKSSYLLTKAKQAAEGVKFDTSPTTPIETKGTITIEL